MADRVVQGLAPFYKTLLIWPYAVAPAVAGVLWLFMFAPSIGVVSYALRALGIDWNHLLDGTDAMILIVMRRGVEADLVQLPVLPRRAAEHPEEPDRGRRDRRRRPVAALLDDAVPAAVADHVLPARHQHRLRVLRHLRHRRRRHRRAAPARTPRSSSTRSTSTASRRSTSAARRRSRVVLMVIVIALTVVQFRYVEKKVQY